MATALPTRLPGAPEPSLAGARADHSGCTTDGQPLGAMGCRYRIACYERPRAPDTAAPEPPRSIKADEGYSSDRTSPAQRLALGRSNLGKLSPRPAPMTFCHRTWSAYVNSPEADIARHISGWPLPSVTRAGVAASRLEPPWRASRRQPEHGGDVQRTSTSCASVGVYDISRRAGASAEVAGRHARGTRFSQLG